MDRTKTSAMVVVLLLCSGASLSKSLRLEHSVDGMNEKDEKRAVAVGVPFRVLAKKGLSANPLEYGKGSAVAIDRASVDDPRSFKVESWDKSGVLLRGLATGETTLRVQGKVGWQKESASLVVRTAVPTGATLAPLCGDTTRRTVWVGVGEPMVVEEKLLSGSAVVMSDRYPEVDFGPFTPPADVGKQFRTSGKAGELIGPIHFEVRAPATPGPAVLKIPEFGVTLPVEVFEPSAVKDVRLEGDGRAQAEGKTSVAIKFLVNDQIPCGRPKVPVEITVGPDANCRLEDEAPFRRLPDKRPGHWTFEGVIAPQALSITTLKAVGDCEVTVAVKGSTGTAGAKRIAVYPKPVPPKPTRKIGGGHGGGGHH